MKKIMQWYKFYSLGLFKYSTLTSLRLVGIVSFFFQKEMFEIHRAEEILKKDLCELDYEEELVDNLIDVLTFMNTFVSDYDASIVLAILFFNKLKILFIASN